MSNQSLLQLCFTISLSLVYRKHNQLEKFEAAKAASFGYLWFLALPFLSIALLDLTQPYWAFLHLSN